MALDCQKPSAGGQSIIHPRWGQEHCRSPRLVGTWMAGSELVGVTKVYAKHSPKTGCRIHMRYYYLVWSGGCDGLLPTNRSRSKVRQAAPLSPQEAVQQMLITQGSRAPKPWVPLFTSWRTFFNSSEISPAECQGNKEQINPCIRGVEVNLYKRWVTSHDWIIPPCSLWGAVRTCEPASTHVLTHMPCANLPSTYRTRSISCLSPCLRDRLSKEQNGKISVCLVVFFPSPLSLSRPPVSLSYLHWLPICSMKLSCVVDIVRIYCKICAWNDFFFLFSFSPESSMDG